MVGCKMSNMSAPHFAIFIVALFCAGRGVVWTLEAWQSEGRYRWLNIAFGAVGIVLGIFCAWFAFVDPVRAETYHYLPNDKLTPGYVEDYDPRLICEADYAKESRHVSKALKERVYERYGVDKKSCRQDCKIDHLIPLAIGGSNDIRNLWPHEYGAEWSVYEKTRLEVRLRKAVCKEGVDAKVAQDCIRNDWTKCHAKYFPGAHEKTVKERAAK